MSAYMNPPEKARLLDIVEGAFLKAGWRGERRDSDHDFSFRAGGFEIIVKCLDESRATFDNAARLITSLEEGNRVFRGYFLPYLVVLDRNFLFADLESLQKRDLMVVTLEDLPLILDLKEFETRLPDEIDPRQEFLLVRSMHAALSISSRYHDIGQKERALFWAKQALEHASGLCDAHWRLFWLYREYGDLDAAAAIGEELRSYRPGDPAVLRLLIDLESQRGNEAEAEKLRDHLENRPTQAFSFDDIIAKQRAQQQRAGGAQPAIAAAAPGKASLWQTLGRLFGGGRG